MNRKSFVVGIVLLLVLAASYMGYKLFFQDSITKETPIISVTTAIVGKVKLHDSVEVLGNAYANESITITSNVSEPIQAIRFSDGQRVKKGAVIALLQQDEEQAQLKAATVQLQEHQRELARLKTLIANKAAAKRELDERKTLIEVTEQQIKEITARIEDRTLRAPFDGRLGVRRLSVGALVQPGQAITTLDDTDTIKLDFNIPESTVPRLKPGVPIEARNDGIGDKVFYGTVDTIDTRIDPVTRSVLVRAILPNDEGLIRSGMLMQVTLLENERETFVIPEEAIFQKQVKHYVFRITPESTIEECEVTIGTRRPGKVEVTNGLVEGDQVVVRGLNMVRPGQKVTVKNASSDAAASPTKPSKE